MVLLIVGVWLGCLALFVLLRAKATGRRLKEPAETQRGDGQLVPRGGAIAPASPAPREPA